MADLNLNVYEQIALTENNQETGGLYHLYIDGQGYILSANINGKKHYQKKRAPHFVNKFGSGDASYRDASFWQFFTQSNWRNGAQQEKWDDPGKFWKSSNVDVTELERVTLSHKMNSIGQLAAGIDVKVLQTWRSSQSWWDGNYGYRQPLTITAPNQAVPKGYPVKITINTATLETASKLQADRDDWRVVYWNGSAWEDLTRDYVSASVTFFGLKKALAANEISTDYYVYYGYASESTNKQPTTEAQWLNVYGFYRNQSTDSDTPDDNTVCLHMFREGTGTNVADHKSTLDGTATGGMTWGTDGKFGRYGEFAGDNDYVDLGSPDALNLGSVTMEGFIYIYADTNGMVFSRDKPYEGGTPNYSTKMYGGGQHSSTFNGSGGAPTSECSTGWHHFATTFDGSTAKHFFDGVQKSSGGASTPTSGPGQATYGRAGVSATEYFKGKMQFMRISNSARTSFPYALTTEPTVTAGAEEEEQPPSSSFDLFGGGSDGKIYKWDGTTTWTEQFDCRNLTWFSTQTDSNDVIGDSGGTEYAHAQSFQLSQAFTVKSIQAYLKKAVGTPGDITVRIETNNAGVPSGTLADANAATTITAFATTDYAWKEATFTTSFALAASTVYWLVLKTAAAGNDNNYTWAADHASPAYSSGNMSTSSNGGSTWTAQTGWDAYFRVQGPATEVNCSLMTDVGGTRKILWGVGDPDGTTNLEARIISYDGTDWAINKVFTPATSSQVLSITEYESKVYAGVGCEGIVYVSTDISTYTESKDINVPNNPGYVHFLKEYNRVLYAGGGSPEFLPASKYNGFLYTYDTTSWNNLYPFDFTILTAAEFYDAFFFIGTYHGQLFVYDTASLTPIFDFNDLYGYQVSIVDMKYYDDKLYMVLTPQEGTGETNVGIWVYDRHGLSLIHEITGAAKYLCLEVIDNKLVVGTGSSGYVYQLDPNSYEASGHVQTSYYDANLPSINKLYADVEIKHDPLASGCSVTVYYKFKESDDWTLLGVSDTLNSTSKVLSFETGIYSKKISLKYIVATTDSSATPILTESIMRYTLYPDRKWMWNIRLLVKKDLKLLNRSDETRTAQEMRDALENLQASYKLINFTDIDGKTYTVLPHDLDESSWVIDQKEANEDEILLTLLEA